MVEERREPRTGPEHTTVVHTDRGGAGAGTVLAVVLAIILIGVLLLFAFGGWLGSETEQVDVPEQVGVDVNVDGGGMRMPDVEAPQADTTAGEQGGNSS